MATTEQDLTTRRAPAPITREDLEEAFQRFKFNSNAANSDAAGAQLMSENFRLREDKRRLEADIKELEKQIPPSTALVLKGDDKKVHEALVAIMNTLPEDKRKPEDLQKLLDERVELSGKVEGLERDKLAAEIAEAEGWKPGSLARLTQGMQLVLEDVEEEVDDDENEGKKKKVQVQRGFVVTKAADGKEIKKRLSEELKEFMPSLAPDGEEENEDEGKRGARSAGGTSFVRQSSGDRVDARKGQKASAGVLSKYSRGRKKQ